jgi:glycosyltransferase involved in cell wall biosynthesis
MNDIKSVSILIPTHNRAALLRQTFDSLAAIRIPRGVDVELVVVANACHDDTVQVCHAEFPAIPFAARCIEEPVPGLSVARNRAIAESTGEVCAFLDDDVFVSPEWLDGMLEVYNNYPADIVGGKIELWWSAVERPGWFSDAHNSLLSGLDHGEAIIEIRPPKYLFGGNSAYRRDVFERAGLFRTDLGRIGNQLGSYEELDFHLRAMEQGARMFYAPRMAIKHWVPPERATVEYLVKVARGNTTSRIRRKPTFGVPEFCRSFARHGYMAVRYEMERWVAKALANQPHEVTCLVRREMGRAGMQATIERWRGPKG